MVMVKPEEADKATEAPALKAMKAADAAKSSADQARSDRAAAENAAKRSEHAASTKPWPLVATVVLTLTPMLVAFYFGTQTMAAVEEDHARMLLSTLVCFLGMAFASLAFGLFLVGATGSFKGNSNTGGKSFNVETAAPGLVVIVCATVVIYLALDVIRPPAPPAPAPPAVTTPGEP